MQQQLDMQDSSGQMGLGSALVQLGLEIASAFVGRAMQSPTHRLTILAMLEGELRRQRRLPAGGFRGLLGCARRTYLYDGPLSFFRGLGTEFVLTLPATIANYAASQIVSLIAQNTINFAAMSEGQQLVASIAFSTLLEQLAAVVQDPIATVTTTYIADIVPETEGGTFAFSGPLAAVKAIYKAKGIAGFYQGISTAALLSISYRWSYYALLHAAFSFLSQEQQDSVGMTVARLISLVSGAFCQPVEVVRRRLQYAAHTDQPYQSTLDCVKTIVKEEGVTALWAGYKMRVLVTLTGFAIVDGLTFLQTQL